MHETVIAKNIIDEAKKHGEVEELFLEVGQLAHVPDDELLECLEGLVDWKIHMDVKPARVRCPGCGYKGAPTILERGHDSFLIECPECKAMPELVDGKDIMIQKVTVK